MKHNKLFFLSIIVLSLLSAGCRSSGDYFLDNLDRSVSPRTDFYQYVNGNWLKDHPLSPSDFLVSTFTELQFRTNERMFVMIDSINRETAAPGSIEQKISGLFDQIMDTEKLDREGAAPIEGDLKRIAGIRERAELFRQIFELQKTGINLYFRFGTAVDSKNSSLHVWAMGQGGLSMPRSYYLDTDENSITVNAKYRDHIVRMFELSGFSAEQARTNMEAVLRIETRLAAAAFDEVKLRDPNANYNRMSGGELRQLVPAFDWDSFFTVMGLSFPDELVLFQKEPLIEAANIIAREPLADHIAYLQWHLIDDAALLLGSDFYAADFDFYQRTLFGQEEMQPRVRFAFEMVNNFFGEALGQMYVEQYFPPAAKERVAQMVAHIREVLRERIRNLQWMSGETKAEALAKLDAMGVKIGYPDKWKDYSALDIGDDSFYANRKRARLFSRALDTEKLGKPVDKTEWGLLPQVINAQYSPESNNIMIPAGILQYPFFDMDADDAFNYGAIGVVIGHELTHGFDDQGRQFDKDGNLRDWWTAEDSERFTGRAQVLVDFFNSLEAAPGLPANGALTLGENIADNGGLHIAYEAFQRAVKVKPLKDRKGFTPSQRFFMANATLWAMNVRPEVIRNITLQDPHSLGLWRVNGALPHIEEWNKAFNVQAGDPLFIPPEKRASIW
ncbi:peptidase M13 [Spirochaetia bacterium]|nr:peptidase M13 [Spirochaetia bacterium]